ANVPIAASLSIPAWCVHGRDVQVDGTVRTVGDDGGHYASGQRTEHETSGAGPAAILDQRKLAKLRESIRNIDGVYAGHSHRAGDIHRRGRRIAKRTEVKVQRTAGECQNRGIELG